MQLKLKWILLGTVLSFEACKSDPPAPNVAAESAKPKTAAPPSASAISSATATALPPYGMEDMLQDMETCAEHWQRSFTPDDGRCDKLLPLWSEGGVEAAIAKYKSGCDNNDGKSCLLLLGALSHPKSPMRSSNLAVFFDKMWPLLLQACKLGEPHACTRIVDRDTCMHENPYGEPSVHDCHGKVMEFLKGKKDEDFAKLLEPGCKNGHAISCTAQADHTKAVKGQVDEVTDLYKRGCELGDARGCSAAARIAETFGNDAERNALNEKKFYWEERECRRLDDCGAIASIYSHHEKETSPERLRTVRELLNGYCAQKKLDDPSCLELAQMQVKGVGGPVELAAAIPRLDALCNSPIHDDYPGYALDYIAISCRMLSTLYKNGTGVGKDEKKAKALMKRACIERDPSTSAMNAACKDLEAMGK